MNYREVLIGLIVVLVIVSVISIGGCAEISTNENETTINISDDIINKNISPSEEDDNVVSDIMDFIGE